MVVSSKQTKNNVEKNRLEYFETSAKSKQGKKNDSYIDLIVLLMKPCQK